MSDSYKIRVQLTTTNILHMREVEVYNMDGVNVALNKAASQSSDMGSSWPASKGVDGAINTGLTQTNREQGELVCIDKALIDFISNILSLSLLMLIQGAWWEVDLGSDGAIAIDQFKEVRIYNRNTGTAAEIGRLSHANVLLKSEDDGIIGEYNLGSVDWAERTFLVRTICN